MAIIATTDLAAYLHRDLMPEEDTLADLAVAAADEIVKSYTGQAIEAAASQAVTLDGTGTQWVLLPEVPVTAVSTVQVDYGTSAVDTLTEGQDDEYLWYADGRLYRVGTVWPTGMQSIRVTYSYGYSSVPDDIKAVAMQVAARIFSQGLVQQESVGGYSANYATDAMGGLAPIEERVLSRYRMKRA